ncbi:MAG: group II intron reverse transcriptase/maturase, partial [bacterium]|nr:group II intron reverse transcriptase/maturase [bacterium]
HAVMVRVRRRIGDRKLTRLVLAFLKAGVLAEEQFLRKDSGTPQGGILSPLLANIALSAIDERYERHVWPRRTPTLRTDPKKIRRRAEANRWNDRQAGRPLLFPIRYADDFIILVGVAPGPQEFERARDLALKEKTDLGAFLKEHLGLELSEEKTLVTPVTEPMLFLGHHVRVRKHPTHGRLVSAVVIPRERSQQLRRAIKDYFRRPTLGYSLEERLGQLNEMLRGWSAFYRYAWGAKRVFARLDHYVWWTIFRWLKKKHPHTSVKRLCALYGWRKPGGRTLRWRGGSTHRFEMATVRVGSFRPWWSITPAFAKDIYGEPGA